MKRPPGATPDMTLRQFVARWRHTLTLMLLVVLLIVPLIVWRAGQASDCRERGGEYVRDYSWSGFTCIGDDR